VTSIIRLIVSFSQSWIRTTFSTRGNFFGGGGGGSSFCTFSDSRSRRCALSVCERGREGPDTSGFGEGEGAELPNFANLFARTFHQQPSQQHNHKQHARGEEWVRCQDHQLRLTFFVLSPDDGRPGRETRPLFYFDAPTRLCRRRTTITQRKLWQRRRRNDSIELSRAFEDAKRLLSRWFFLLSICNFLIRKERGLCHPLRGRHVSAQAYVLRFAGRCG